MKKIARVLLNRDMLMLYIVNFLLADTAIFVFFLVMAAAFLEKYNYLILAVIIMVGRLFILPNFYNWFVGFAKEKYIQDFLYGLRYSIKVKILVAILSPIPFIIECFILSKCAESGFGGLLDGIITLYVFSLFAGLLGSYVILYMYWYINDKIKNSKVVKSILYNSKSKI